MTIPKSETPQLQTYIHVIYLWHVQRIYKYDTVTVNSTPVDDDIVSHKSLIFF
jgi:hypothetical protein